MNKGMKIKVITYRGESRDEFFFKMRYENEYYSIISKLYSLASLIIHDVI